MTDNPLATQGWTDLEERIGWAILTALHENVEEAKRPQGWTDLTGDQLPRIHGAAKAAIRAQEAPTTEIDRLRALLRQIACQTDPKWAVQLAKEALADGDGWLPIETAPKDGTHVLLFSPDAAEPRLALGHWLEFDGDPDGGAWFDTWDFSGRPIDAEPTHWISLPKVPG